MALYSPRQRSQELIRPRQMRGKDLYMLTLMTQSEVYLALARLMTHLQLDL